MGKIQKRFVVFCVIYTVITLVNGLILQQLDMTLLLFSVFVSAAASFFTFLLEEKEAYSNRRLLINQCAYVMILFALILLISWLNYYEISFVSVGLNGAIIFVLFGIIKFLFYQKDKKEAAQINQRIQELK